MKFLRMTTNGLKTPPPLPPPPKLSSSAHLHHPVRLLLQRHNLKQRQHRHQAAQALLLQRQHRHPAAQALLLQSSDRFRLEKEIVCYRTAYRHELCAVAVRVTHYHAGGVASDNRVERPGYGNV
jgi:hypothetical protein